MTIQTTETTENTTVDPILEDAPQDVTSAPETPDAAPADHEPDEGKHGREAARYRRQLREVEGERDTLRGQLDAMRRSVVDGMVEAAHLKPTALWASGAQLDALLDEAGVVDPVKVAAAIDGARDTLGIPPVPRAPSAEGQGRVGLPIGGGSPAPTFADAFRPR